MNTVWKILSTRLFFWPLLVVPGIWRIGVPAMKGKLGLNPLLESLHRSGQIAVWLLVAVLALTPLKALLPRLRLVAVLNRHRRGIGVAAFAYGALHVVLHFIYEGGFLGFWGNLRIPFFLTGTAAFAVMTLLAITSNDFSIRLLRYKNWKWLHRLAYVSALALVWHVGVTGKGNWAFARMVFVPLLALQLLALAVVGAKRLFSIWRRRHEWEGWREFVVAHRELESETITSFCLRPADGRRLPHFKPGQFLTVRLEIPGETKPVVRPYTISQAPDGRTYRLTIKRESAASPDVPPGLASNHFHDRMQVGSRLVAKPPAGKFHLDDSSTRPVVLLSAGVGVTPMIAMLEDLLRRRDPRPIWFLHGARNSREHAFGTRVRQLAAAHLNLRVHVCYSQPELEDLAASRCDASGRIDIERIQQLLPDKHADFYLCGPAQFMKSLHDGLIEWGVPVEQIHYEFFGPATVKLGVAQNENLAHTIAPAVRFEPGGVPIRWDGTQSNLLDFALAAGLKPEFGCKAGACGACACRLISGKVKGDSRPSATVSSDSILLCCVRPESDVVLDLG